MIPIQIIKVLKNIIFIFENSKMKTIKFGFIILRHEDKFPCVNFIFSHPNFNLSTNIIIQCRERFRIYV